MQEKQAMYRTLTDAIRRANPRANGRDFGRALGTVQELVTGMKPFEYKEKHNLGEGDAIYNHLDEKGKKLFEDLLEVGAELLDSGCTFEEWEGKMLEERNKLVEEPSTLIEDNLLKLVQNTAIALENGSIEFPVKRVTHDLVLATELLKQGLTKTRAMEILSQYRTQEINTIYTHPYGDMSPYKYLQKVVGLAETSAFNSIVNEMREWKHKPQ